MNHISESIDRNMKKISKRNTFWHKRKRALESGLTIKQQTVEEFLAEDGKIQIVESGFNYAEHEEMQRQKWCNKNKRTLGNGAVQKRVSLDLISEIVEGVAR